jgi:DNA-binding transcriptional regulator YhcF (GntR family)
MKSILDIIRNQNENTHLLKHEQIVEGVLDALRLKVLIKGDILPSVNTAVEEIGIARKTVVKAYDVLKKRGLIRSKKRLGYYVVGTNAGMKRKVLLMLNSFNPYQQQLYETILEKTDPSTDQVDLFFHHTNPRMFETIIDTNSGHYTHYIITPFDHDKVKKSIARIPKERLLLISRPYFHDKAESFVVQDYSTGLTEVLNNAKPDLLKYKSLKLVFSSINNPPAEIKDTVSEFCKSIKMDFSIIQKCVAGTLKKDNIYFIIEDNDLQAILLECRDNNLVPGKDIGILSYNDSPMKQLIGNGISTVSVDFREMGLKISEWLFDQPETRIVLPTHYYKRNSI